MWRASCFKRNFQRINIKDEAYQDIYQIALMGDLSIGLSQAKTDSNIPNFDDGKRERTRQTILNYEQVD